MPNKYKFDAERWLRNNKGRIGTNPINGDDIATAIADEIQRLRAEADTLRNESEFYRKQCDMRDEWRDKIEAELAALQEAVEWERECRFTRNTMRLWHVWPAQDEAQGSYLAARAEVDRLIADANAADCEVEG